VVLGADLLVARAVPVVSDLRLALNMRNASIAIDLEPESRWLESPDCPIPWVDARKPGAKLPLKRWRVRDLEDFLLDRLVDPGRNSPLGG
jgi:hypothetical protein